MYATEVLDRRGRTLFLRLQPEQPDCMPYYLSREFAAATLWFGGGALGAAERDDRFFDDLALGRRSGDAWVESVALLKVHQWPWRYGDPDTWADYRIEVTAARWADGLAPGRRFENYAYSESGAYLSAIAIGAGGLPRGSLYWPGTPPVAPARVIEDPAVLALLPP